MSISLKLIYIYHVTRFKPIISIFLSSFSLFFLYEKMVGLSSMGNSFFYLYLHCYQELE